MNATNQTLTSAQLYNKSLAAWLGITEDSQIRNIDKNLVLKLSPQTRMVLFLIEKTTEYLDKKISSAENPFNVYEIEILRSELKKLGEAAIKGDGADFLQKRSLTRGGIFPMFPALTCPRSLALGDIALADTYSDVKSRKHVTLESTLAKAADGKPALISAYPIVSANMRSVGSTELYDAIVNSGGLAFLHRFKRPLNAADVDSDKPSGQSEEEARAEKTFWVNRYKNKAVVSCGVKPSEIEFTKTLLALGAGGVCVDIAKADSEVGINSVSSLREYIDANNLPARIIAGNICHGKAYRNLVEAGADCVKVGIGPGSPCTTRGTTKAGLGQASALMSVAQMAFLMGDKAVPFIADGGIQKPGDIVLCLALGASAVMCGQHFAKVTESGALKRTNAQKNYQEVFYFGEASRTARLLNGDSMQDTVAEGEGRWVRASGSFAHALGEYTGAIRNALPYYGAHCITDLHERFSMQEQLLDLLLQDPPLIWEVAAEYAVESATRL